MQHELENLAIVLRVVGPSIRFNKCGMEPFTATCGQDLQRESCGNNLKGESPEMPRTFKDPFHLSARYAALAEKSPTNPRA
ncbi:hypothetical protein SLEP1_g57331 [Rubroshorea leprosula]|uniref:Uncharacterized protein n=1 Tax=Rubroshorea leprosula TaxID=152421 RepID=A0AAV5MKW9_9ROSI|nr:hypothetical protein SLEP1_g57331 [Rubroshorea leprosula]